jgi:hypothetical protein
MGGGGAKGRTGLGLLTLVALAGVCLFAASESPARTVTPYAYSGNSFNGAGSTQGQFTSIDNLDLDQATGNVIVLDTGPIDFVAKFDPTGVPVPFSGLAGSNAITGFEFNNAFGSAPGPEIAVDNSGGTDQSDFYVHEGGIEGLFQGFDSSGVPLPSPWPLCGAFCGFALWGGQEGMATDPEGKIWIADSSSVGQNNDSEYGLYTINHQGEVERRLITKASKAGIFHRFDFDSAGNIVLSTELDPSFGSKYQEVKKIDTDLNAIQDALGPGPGHGIAVDRSDDTVFVNQGSLIEVYDSSGALIDSFGSPEGPYIGLENSVGTAVRWSNGTVYAGNENGDKVDIFQPGPQVIVPTVTSDEPQPAATGSTALLSGTIDPDNGGDTTDCRFEYGTTADTPTTVPCVEGTVFPSAGGAVDVTAPLAGLTKGTRYFFRLYSNNANDVEQGSRMRSFIAANPPVLQSVVIGNVNTNTADVEAVINPEGDRTQYRVEYGLTPALGETNSSAITAGNLGNQSVTSGLSGLTPGSTYYYRLVAENVAGSVAGPVKTFNTFAFDPIVDDKCENALARQQTGSSFLLDCRAYELVSAANATYNVESDLVPGQTPYPGFPDADGKVLYAVHDGGISGTGHPTNLGPDPYVATRGASGWSTTYVGIPANVNTLTDPFSSTVAGAGASLGAFVFGGPGLCAPCFADGSTGLPIRLPGGGLVQGMRGTLPVANPEHAGQVKRHLSSDGTHLIFGSEQKFELAGNSGSVTIYDRDLESGVTQVVSTMPDGSTMTGDGVAQLDVSADGERVLIGLEVGAPDPAGNQRFDLYMHVGTNPKSVQVVDSPNGVIYNGMSDDGSRVYFTTADSLESDGDSSPDLFRADVGTVGATVVRASTGSEGSGQTDACDPITNADGPDWNAVTGGPHCGTVAIGGGGGVASDSGRAYFLSPERLDGPANGSDGDPNLYVATPGGATRYVTTLEPNHPLVRNAVADSEERITSDFETNSSGREAVFPSSLPLTGFENLGFTQVYAFDVQEGELSCASCNPSNAPSTGNAELASNGSSLTDDGRVFFTSTEQLALRDANLRTDVYEWTPEDGSRVELISTGIDIHNSRLLTVTADGTDAYFFTRETLAPQDKVGPLVKIYTAREKGGFFVIPPSPPCAASDECHGPGTQAAPPRNSRTVAGTPGQVPSVEECDRLSARARKQASRARSLRSKARRASSKAVKARLRGKARRASNRAIRSEKAALTCHDEKGVG